MRAGALFAAGAAGLVLGAVFLANDEDAGKGADVENDLRYENISFLRYLYEEYGA